MTTHSTQLVVVGAGPGGYAAAFLAADLGIRTTLIGEDPQPGGVCLYRGCIPSKALLHVAGLLAEARHASRWGVSFADPKIDLDKLRQWKDSVVSKQTGGLAQLSKLRGVTYLQGFASLVDPRTLDVKLADGVTRVTAEHIVLATGSRPATLPGVNLSPDRLLDSTSALEIASVPGSLLVVGGGYIGLELGTVYAALGTKVSVVEMLPGLLPGADRDLAAIVARRAETMFESVKVQTKVVELVDDGQKVRATFEDAAGNRTQQHFDKVLVAIGRKPNSQVPGLDRTKVEVDKRGFIRVDEQRRTAEPTIFAIGDVAGEPMLAHKASHEGRAAVEAIAGHKVVFEPAAIPAVVFTDPELAWCGLTETEAKATNRPIEVAKFPWGASGRATTLDRPDGLTKLVIEPGTGRVLGMGIVGVGAGELIAEGVLAIEMGAVAKDIALTIHPHPTLSETTMEAGEVFYGLSTHVFKPKKAASAVQKNGER